MTLPRNTHPWFVSAFLLAPLILFLGGCTSSSGGKSDAGCPAGNEKCLCFANDTCEDGLTCASNRCVRFDGGGVGGAAAGGSAGAGAGGTSSVAGAVGTGGAAGSAGAAGSGGIAGATGTAGTGASGAGGAPTDAGRDTLGTQANIGFSCTLNCSGSSTVVFIGARPPQTAGADVIAWTSSTGTPTGDQLWAYDGATRLLVNSINQLALMVRSDHSLGLGSSATDGTPLTMRANVDGSTSLVFDDGNLIGIGSTNCAGAVFMSVSAGTAGDGTAFTLH